jgi:hypothetical protein
MDIMSRLDPTSFVLMPDHPLLRLQRTALTVGVLALALSAVGAAASPQQFFRSYLVAYLFWFGIPMGSLAILMIHHVAGGAWGAVIRRVLESSTRTVPALALLFVPLLFGIGSLYEWAHPAEVAHDALLQEKAMYLNVPFFLLRTAAYFVVWCVLVHYLNRWSLEQDTSSAPRLVRRLELLSRGGLVALVGTMSFAAVDWMMSLEPHWFSTIYGLVVMGGQLLVGMAFTICILLSLTERGPLDRVVSDEHFHDLGKLMLAFTMLWAYFAFSQLLIVWSGNLPEETPWYLKRMAGGWQYLGAAIIILQFLLPFFLLLSRRRKRDAGRLARVALLIIAASFVNLFWLVVPAFYPGKFSLHWLDIACLVGVGGLWLWAFVHQLKGRSILAVNDPKLPEFA